MHTHIRKFAFASTLSHVCQKRRTARCSIQHDVYRHLLTPTPALPTAQNDGMSAPPAYDYLVVGAGPAGLQAAHLLQRANRSFRVLEASARVAPFFREHPRHGKLISINKAFNSCQDPDFALRHDWCGRPARGCDAWIQACRRRPRFVSHFRHPPTTARNSLLSDDASLVFPEFNLDFFPPREAMVEYLEAYTTKLGLSEHIDFESRVTAVTKDAEGMFVLTVGGATPRTLRTRALLMATGCVSEYTPDIPGLEDLPSYATHDLDKRAYRRKKVLVIGMGNSAFEVRLRRCFELRLLTACAA